MIPIFPSGSLWPIAVLDSPFRVFIHSEFFVGEPLHKLERLNVLPDRFNATPIEARHSGLIETPATVSDPGGVRSWKGVRGGNFVALGCQISVSLCFSKVFVFAKDISARKSSGNFEEDLR